ncbi:MAG: hypothetical protein Q9160_007301 [Pyrenula sp. 1 TL-2023]
MLNCSNVKLTADAMSLGPVSEKQLQSLVATLWGQVCGECQRDPHRACLSTFCPWSRSKRLSRYFEYYRYITASYLAADLSGQAVALRTHEDFFEVIQAIKRSPDTPRSRLEEEYFAGRNDGRTKIPPSEDQTNAFNLAVRAMIMVNCSLQHHSSGFLELGSYPASWRSSLSFSQFIESAFPKHEPLLAEDDAALRWEMKTAIKAIRLRKKAGLRFHPTDDLSSHLKLDRRNGIVEIYHHTAVSKQHLTSSRDLKSETPLSQVIAVGNLPRQLILEILDSFQMILFPQDKESQMLLQQLVKTYTLDRDCLRFESAFHRSDGETEVQYHYLATRLADLYEEVQHPTPRTFLQKWLQRRSGERHVMQATLIGVLIAILLGIAGLAVSIFQAWVGYQQWKHPVST